MIRRYIRAAFNLVFHRKRINYELKRLTVEDNGKVEMLMRHPAFSDVARIFGEAFIGAGAINCFEVKMFDPSTIGVFTLTIQREGKPSFPQINAGLREALELIHADPTNAKAIAGEVLERYGYKAVNRG